MSWEISLSPVRISDASKLKAAGLLGMSTGEITLFLRESMSDPTKCFYVASLSSDSEGDRQTQIIALVGLLDIHPIHQNGFIYCEFACQVGCLEQRIKVLDTLLRLAFFSKKLHRLSWIIPTSDHEDENIAIDCGMRQEAVLEEVLYKNNKFVDAGLFFLLAAEYPDYAVAFVPFSKGVISVCGSSKAIEGIQFYKYGQAIDDPYTRCVAIHTGVADVTGHLMPKGSDAYCHYPNRLPVEVAKAVRELKEYFAKSRTKFTVAINFAYGSHFQRHVWQQLQQIPYGHTVSYEDIALALTGNDKVAARNLARAVGAACGDNPIPILVPCHRVIGKDGRLVGFSGGVENKEFLLDHEIFCFFREIN